MFTSSMARRNNSSDFRKKKEERTKKAKSPLDFFESDIVINGSKESMRTKESLYQSNTAKTISPSSLEALPPRSDVKISGKISKICLSTDELYDTNDNLSTGEYESVYRAEVQPSSFERNTDWYLDPIHRRTCNFMPEFRPYDHDSECDFEDDELLSVRDFHNAEKAMLRSRVKTICESTPYESTLYRLRYEKLKLEEAFLLKTKCEQELERTRGPKPKWYELKTKDFTVEMKKHKNILQKEQTWPELIEYRNKLLELSGEWTNLRH